ncbi:unnamed protein product [Vitrella brassicaformis CCMP3155]|uniref:non-specific serine/threonine protein kinase n=3 Tax=Vitrella brassicaformis TaxID=1169539 RepID=A0A0G4FL79_VITBC|nr:unnamed protein product [Vitrella brassicaformis CCMP3155]|eukprot:CEM14746.1 unnamed protein product [Vitrella brassicaformis CCMP3155]
MTDGETDTRLLGACGDRIHPQELLFDSGKFQATHEGHENIDEYQLGGYHPVKPGQLYNDRYRTCAKLGNGQYSTVWLALDTKSKRTKNERRRYVALKFARSHRDYAMAAQDEIAVAETVRRALLSSSRLEYKKNLEESFPEYGRTESHKVLLNSTHVLRLEDRFVHHGPHGKHHVIVFELLGPNLLELIRFYQKCPKMFCPLEVVRNVSCQLLIGLHFLHSFASILHTDLKPENILVSTATFLNDIDKVFRDFHHDSNGDDSKASSAVSPNIDTEEGPKAEEAPAAADEPPRGSAVANGVPQLTLPPPATASAAPAAPVVAPVAAPVPSPTDLKSILGARGIKVPGDVPEEALSTLDEFRSIAKGQKKDKKKRLREKLKKMGVDDCILDLDLSVMPGTATNEATADSPDASTASPLTARGFRQPQHKHKKSTLFRQAAAAQRTAGRKQADIEERDEAEEQQEQEGHDDESSLADHPAGPEDAPDTVVPPAEESVTAQEPPDVADGVSEAPPADEEASRHNGDVEAPEQAPDNEALASSQEGEQGAVSPEGEASAVAVPFIAPDQPEGSADRPSGAEADAGGGEVTATEQMADDVASQTVEGTQADEDEASPGKSKRKKRGRRGGAKNKRKNQEGEENEGGTDSPPASEAPQDSVAALELEPPISGPGETAVLVEIEGPEPASAAPQTKKKDKMRGKAAAADKSENKEPEQEQGDQEEREVDNDDAGEADSVDMVVAELDREAAEAREGGKRKGKSRKKGRGKEGRRGGNDGVSHGGNGNGGDAACVDFDESELPRGKVDVPYVKKELKPSRSDPSLLTTYEEEWEQSYVKPPYQHFQQIYDWAIKVAQARARSDAKNLLYYPILPPEVNHPVYFAPEYLHSSKRATAGCEVPCFYPTPYEVRYLPSTVRHDVTKKSLADYSKCVADCHIFHDDTAEFKIADLGNCMLDLGMEREVIQTRQYRAPEAVLQIQPYSFTTDIWSLACVIYELVTGEFLFEMLESEDPENDDLTHIALFIETLGPLPEDIYQKSEKYQRFYPFLSDKKKNPDRSISRRLREIRKDLGEFERQLLVQFLEPMLEYDPAKRHTADKLLANDFFTRRLRIDSMVPYSEKVEETWSYCRRYVQQHSSPSDAQEHAEHEREALVAAEMTASLHDHQHASHSANGHLQHALGPRGPFYSYHGYETEGTQAMAFFDHSDPRARIYQTEQVDHARAWRMREVSELEVSYDQIRYMGRPDLLARDHLDPAMHLGDPSLYQHYQQANNPLLQDYAYQQANFHHVNMLQDIAQAQKTDEARYRSSASEAMARRALFDQHRQQIMDKVAKEDLRRFSEKRRQHAQRDEEQLEALDEDEDDEDAEASKAKDRRILSRTKQTHLSRVDLPAHATTGRAHHFQRRFQKRPRDDDSDECEDVDDDDQEDERATAAALVSEAAVSQAILGIGAQDELDSDEPTAPAKSTFTAHDAGRGRATKARPHRTELTVSAVETDLSPGTQPPTQQSAQQPQSMMEIHARVQSLQHQVDHLSSQVDREKSKEGSLRTKEHLLRIEREKRADDKQGGTRSGRTKQQLIHQQMATAPTEQPSAGLSAQHTEREDTPETLKQNFRAFAAGLSRKMGPSQRDTAAAAAAAASGVGKTVQRDVRADVENMSRQSSGNSNPFQLEESFSRETGLSLRGSDRERLMATQARLPCFSGAKVSIATTRRNAAGPHPQPDPSPASAEAGTDNGPSFNEDVDKASDPPLERPIPCVPSPESIATDGDGDDSAAESSQPPVIEREGDAEGDVDGDETALYHDAEGGEGQQGEDEGVAEAADVEAAPCEDLPEDCEQKEDSGAECEEGGSRAHERAGGEQEEGDNEAEEGIADPDVAEALSEFDSDSDDDDDLPVQDARDLRTFAGFVSQGAMSFLPPQSVSEWAEVAPAVSDSACPAGDHAIVHRGSPTLFQHTHSTELPSSTSGNGEDAPSTTTTTKRDERQKES